MTQDEIDARLAALGGTGLTHTKVASRKTIKVTRTNSLGDPVESDAEVTVQRWTNEQTGAVLEAYQQADGTWQIVKDDPRGVTPSQAGPRAAPGGKPYTDDGPDAGSTGRRWGWNQDTGLYDRDLGPSPSAQQVAAPRAAPGGKPFTDDGPDAGTTGRHWGWNAETGLYDRDLGPSPSAQKPDAAEDGASNRESKTVNGKSYTRVTEKKGNDQRTYWLDENGKEVPEPVATTAASQKTPVLAPDKKSYGYFNDKNEWVTIPPEKAPPLPGEDAKPPTQVEGVYGQWRQHPETKAWSFEPVENQPGAVKLPSGAPPMDISSPKAAFDSFQRLTAWVHQQVSEGKVQPGQVKSILEAPHAQVNMILDREKSERSDALTQRGQDVGVHTNALSNATTGYTSTLGHAMTLARGVTPGQGHTMNFLLGGLALQRAQAANLGWNPNGIAPVMANPMGNGGVVPGPVAAALPPPPAGAPVATPAILQGSSLDPNAGAAPVPPAPPAVPMSSTGVPLPAPIFAPQPPAELPPPEAPADPQAMPFGAPVMALSKSMGGQGYAPAIASLKRMGLDDDTINLALQQFMAGE